MNRCQKLLPGSLALMLGAVLAACGQPGTPASDQLAAGTASSAPATQTTLPTPTVAASSVPTATATPTSGPVSTTRPTTEPALTSLPQMAATDTATMDTGLAASGHSMASMSPQQAVTIRLFSFEPEPLAIQAGTTITWTNTDDIGHSVTSGTAPTRDGTFDSGLFEQGGTFAYTFTAPGTYMYFCTRHTSMVGTINVAP